MNIDRGTFFHDIYRIEQKLGRTFRELTPHALFPIDEYFNSTERTQVAVVSPFPVQTDDLPKAKRVLRFPVKRAA